MFMVLMDEPGLSVYSSPVEAVRDIEPPDAEGEFRAAFDDAAVPYRVEWLKRNRRGRLLFIEAVEFGKYQFVPSGDPDPAGLVALLEGHLGQTGPADVRSELQVLLERYRVMGR